MKILIHGRKNGYTVLYPRPTPIEFYSFASDIQSISANNYDVYYGKIFYTLAFVDGGCVFTKYVIGDDVERGQLGEIGISVFIPNTQKLSGADVKTLLDELINTYITEYIYNHKICEPKNGFDWLLFASLANGYDAKLSRSTNNDNVTTGTQDPAFHYYKSDSELIEHLDKPFQDEYSDYKQILFIDSNLQGNANPLNVLKNSGVEVIPDLENEYYYLSNYNSTKGVKITANGKLRSDKKGENQIRAKWHIEIKYSKDDRCYEPINVHGTLSDTSSEIHKYLEIKGNQIVLKYDAFNNSNERVTQVAFEIKDRNGKSIEGAEIQIDTRPWTKMNESYTTIDFKGEEIIKQWKISARKESENLYSDTISVTPDTQIGSVVLTLEKQKVPCQKTTDVPPNKTYKIDAGEHGKKAEYCPGYSKSRNGNDLDNNCIIPNKDYIFKNWELINDTLVAQFEKKIYFYQNPKIIAGTLISAIVLGVGILVFFHFLERDKQPKETPLTTQKITDYVEGDSIFLNTLYAYKKKWEKQEQDFITKSGGGMFGGNENVDSTKWKNDWKPPYESIDRAIKKRELINNKNIAELRNQRYSNGQLSFKTAIEKIDSTKYAAVRIKLGDVSALTLTQITDSINSILTTEVVVSSGNDNAPDYIKTYLTTSSIFQLDYINKYYAVSGLSTELNNSLYLIKMFLNNGCKNCETFKINTSNDKFLKENQNLESWVNTVCKDGKSSPTATSTQENSSTTGSQTASNNTSVIIQYIKGSVLDKAKLNEYKNTKGINQNLKNSIQLCLDFWVLNGSSNKTYWTFLKKVNADNNLKNSKLIEFLNKMCQEEASISYSEIDKKKGLK